MQRTVLHADANSFYASCECLYNPNLCGKPVAVCGDPSLRHGIVLAKTDAAKKMGVRTAQPIGEAKQICPELILLPTHNALYLEFSKRIRRIFSEYSDYVEPFGLDEAWIDVTRLGGNGALLADEMRGRVHRELGLTLSIGVSFNKIFSKLGSDMKKPDATTVITRENYREKIWPLPVGELLYVGHATQRKLVQSGILTIGDLARAHPSVLTGLLGKNGRQLWASANGHDDLPVLRTGGEDAAKSIGNSTTPPRDLVCEEDAKRLVYLLSESVASSLRDERFRATVLQVQMRDASLSSIERQVRLTRATQFSGEIAEAAMALIRANWIWPKPMRALGVRASGLKPADSSVQLSFLEDEARAQRGEQLENAIDGIRRRFGHFVIQRGMMLEDQPMTRLNPREASALQTVAFKSHERTRLEHA